MAQVSIASSVERHGKFTGPRLCGVHSCVERISSNAQKLVDQLSGTSASSIGEESWSQCSSDELILDSIPSFEEFLLLGWEEKVREGLFNYSLSTCLTKLIPGKIGFIAQLNEGRATKKRRTEFQIDRVLQDFEHSKFNFTKVDERECLFAFEGDNNSVGRNSASNSDSPNLVLINVSPIEQGHVLLVPFIFDCIPQHMESKFALLALQFAASIENSNFRLGYNSLGAFGTVNHLHFQGYYFDHPFPVEKADKHLLLYRPQVDLEDTECSCNTSVPRIYELDEHNFPVRGLVIESQGCPRSVALILGDLCAKLQLADVPFNFLVCDRGSRIYIWPQKFAERLCASEVPQDLLDMGVNPAVFEISGHIVLKRKSDYECIDEKNAWRLLQLASLNATEFNRVKTMVGVK